MSPRSDTKPITTVLSNLAKRFKPSVVTPPADDVDGPVHLMVYSFMLWESTPKAAARSMRALSDHLIDVNELRVALPEETAELCTAKPDALSVERAARLRASLNDLYGREHAVTLERVAGLSKRDARDFLNSLEGMPPFVAARITLHGFKAHAMPVDELLCARLRSIGVVAAEDSLEDVERMLERKVRASEAPNASLLLEAWRDGSLKSATEKPTTTKKATSRGSSASSSKKTAKKRAKKRTKKSS